MKDKIKALLKQYDNKEIDSDTLVDTLLEYMGYSTLYAKGDEDLYAETVELLKDLDYISTSVLQKRFRIGYIRAVRLIDRLEDDGIIGTPDKNNKRKVIKQSK